MTTNKQQKNDNHDVFQLNPKKVEKTLSTIVQIVGEQYHPEKESMPLKQAKKFLKYDGNLVIGAEFKCLEIVKGDSNFYFVNTTKLEEGYKPFIENATPEHRKTYERDKEKYKLKKEAFEEKQDRLEEEHKKQNKPYKRKTMEPLANYVPLSVPTIDDFLEKANERIANRESFKKKSFIYNLFTI